MKLIHPNILCMLTRISFLPVCFLRQFLNIGNIYFVFCAIIINIPFITPFINYLYPIPVFIIIMISVIRELFEEYVIIKEKKRKNDKLINSRTSFVLEKGKFISKNWKDLKVGNIVKVNEGEIIPADILLIISSEEEGTCYIQTLNLDGY